MIGKKKYLTLGVVLVNLLLITPVKAELNYSSYSDKVTLITQYSTGEYSDTNCGIASLKMALDYLGVESESVEKLREAVRPQAGNVYTNEITDYLDANGIPYKIEFIHNSETLVKALDSGILMLCLDMARVNNASYNGHYIIITGKRIEENNTYLEVYDSMYYTKQYYELEKVAYSAQQWWGSFFIFSKENNQEQEAGTVKELTVEQLQEFGKTRDKLTEIINEISVKSEATNKTQKK